MLGFVAENILNGLVTLARYDEVDAEGHYVGEGEGVLLDVREDAERMLFHLEGSVHIPLGELRERLGELDPNKTIIAYCAVGVRSYAATRILAQHGFEKVKTYPGGSGFFRALHYEETPANTAAAQTAPVTTGPINIGEEKTPMQDTQVSKNEIGEIKAKLAVDCSGTQCPGPIMTVFSTVKEIQDGDVIQVTATDLGFGRDVEAWCRPHGQHVPQGGAGG